MNGKQAKRLRKMVYGDFSLREKKVYEKNTHAGSSFNHKGRIVGKGQVIVTGRRWSYKVAKKIFKALTVKEKSRIDRTAEPKSEMKIISRG